MISGEDIKDARHRAGLSQEALADAVGVTLRTIGNWERGTTVPRNRLPTLRTVLGDHLDAGMSNSPRLRAASNKELLHEISRRLERTVNQEEGLGNGQKPAEKTGVTRRTPRTYVPKKVAKPQQP